MDRIPISQNKDIKVDDIETNSAEYNSKKRLIDMEIESISPRNKDRKFFISG